MNAKVINRKLVSFLEDSPSPYHAARSIATMLTKGGFIELSEPEKWQLQKGQPYFFLRDDGTVISFNLGKNHQEGFRFLGAHTDSPSLKLKPIQNNTKDNYFRLGVEVYGGALLNPWFDRELSIAGRVSYQTAKGKLFCHLIDFASPLAIIPSLAIHLDRNANSDKTINPQTDINPVIGTANTITEFNDILLKKINKQIGKDKAVRVLGHDLFFYDYHKPCLAGLENDFLHGSRLDNLLSCFVATLAATKADRNLSFILMCYNHEEVGSNTSSGAMSNIVPSLLNRLFSDQAECQRALANSFCISIDNAHASHPNFGDKHDSCHPIQLNGGPVLKTNANQKYASNSISNSIFKSLCSEINIPCQDFVMRNDMACGSTIGPITAAKLGLKTVDVGVPSLAMHSIRETTGAEDPYLLYRVISHFLQRDQLPNVVV